MSRGLLAVVVSCLVLFAAAVWATGERPPTRPLAVLHAVWSSLENDLYDADRVRARLTPRARADLEAAARSAPDLYAFAPTLAAFVDGLGVSHTAFFTDRSIEWYFFRSLFATRDPDMPTVRHMGAQFAVVDGTHVIRAVLDGGPADRAGLRRGDAVLTAEQRPFDPWSAFASVDAPVRLQVQRHRERFEIDVVPVTSNPHRAFIDAISASRRTIGRQERRFGYLRLWLGTHPETVVILEEAVRDSFVDHDGLVLDLRGGFGGAWHPHLDVFFADRSDYFTTYVVDRNGQVETIVPEPVDRHAWYEGPLVVLIDEGTRSGKEALAWQFKRRPATVLVGTTTAGAFTGGRGEFLKPGSPYLLYMAVAEYRLDGEVIEGVGVSPDIRIDYPLNDAPPDDPQLDRAVLELNRLVDEHGPGRFR